MKTDLKRLLSFIAAMAFAFTTMAAMGVTAFAAGEEDVWYVGWTEGYEKYIGWLGKGAEFSIDAKNYYKDSEYKYSIKMDNNAEEYNYTCVDKTIPVEPLTEYRFSAMVKYEGHQLDPAATGDLKGAFLREFYVNEEGKWVNHNHSKTTTSGEWTELECFFTTVEGQQTATLNLFNGYTNTLNKGTAWFSDIKVEKVDKTNQWDVLLLVLKNVEADVTLDGETYTYTDNFNDEDVAYIRDDIVGRMKDSVHVMSDELVNIKNIDTYAIEDIVTEKELRTALNDDGSVKGYFLDVASDKIADIISTYTAKKNYNQIIFFLPVQGISRYWLGLGGSKTQNIHFCQLNYKTGTESYHWKNKDGSIFPESAVIHEMLHGVDNDSRVFYDSNTPTLHENIGIYSEYYNGDDGWYSYQCDYMTKNLPDGRGIDPRAFWRSDGTYTMYNNDMEVGGLIKPLPTADTVTDKPVIISTEPTAGGAKITWTPVNGAVKYRVFNFTEGSKVRQFGEDTTETTMEVKGLKGGTETGIIVLAQLANGKWTKYTDDDIAYVVPDDAVKPYLCANPKENGDVYLIWSSVPTSVRYKIMGREVYADGTRGEWKLLDATRQRCRKTIGGLDPNKQYEFLVRGLDSRNKYTPFDASDLVISAPLS